jgi:hypothetical protein
MEPGQYVPALCSEWAAIQLAQTIYVLKSTLVNTGAHLLHRTTSRRHASQVVDEEGGPAS